MKSKTVFWLFVVVALVQLAVPASMIWRHERTLTKGEVYKFRTAPVDPYDAFRGRYVALRFEQSQATLPAGATVKHGQTVYAVVEVGGDGFARFGAAALSPPENQPYLKAQVGYSTGNNVVSLDLPFDRFYMEESRAPAAEQAYREHSRRGQQDAYVLVRVRNGTGVIEDLYVGGKPIGEFLRNQSR